MSERIEHGYVRIGDEIFEITTLPADAYDDRDDRWFPEWTRDFWEIEMPEDQCMN